MLERLLDGIRGDLVKDHAAERQLAQVGSLDQVPGDSFALTVGVGRQKDPRRLLGGGLDLLDRLRLVGRHDVLGCKPVLDVYAQVGLRQVTDVAHRRPDVVLTAKDSRYRSCLGR